MFERVPFKVKLKLSIGFPSFPLLSRKHRASVCLTLLTANDAKVHSYGTS
eukprot:UN07519